MTIWRVCPSDASEEDGAVVGRSGIKRVARASASSVLHPFLFSANAVLIDWLANFDQVHPYVVILPLLLGLLATAGLLYLTKLLLKDKYWAGLALTAVLLFVLHYSFLLDLLEVLPGSVYVKWIPPLAAVAMLTGLAVVVKRHPSFPNSLNPFLNLFSAIWVAMALTGLASAQLEFLEFRAQHIKARPVPLRPIAAPASDRDVYYILLDGYGREDELLADYGFDNSWFIDQLEQMGFVVPECTLSNYAFTALSLASSLNMEYIQNLGLSESENHTEVEYLRLADYINRNEVRRRFEQMGFTTVVADNGIRWAYFDGAVPLNRSGAVANILSYGFHFLSKTAFLPFITPDLNVSGMVKYHRTLAVLDAVQRLPEQDGNTFALIHILAPHSPFVFGENGEYVRDWAASAIEDPDGYRRQYAAEVRYLNTRMLEVVRAILSESKSPPIIVIQGDHSWSLGDNSQPQILNAYFLPDGGSDRLYSQITPVNTFRLILDFYFGDANGALDDWSYFSVLLQTPYRFEEVPSSCASLPRDQYPSLFTDAVQVVTGTQWNERRTRLMGDVNGDGKADIIGVGPGGILVGLSEGTAFAAARYWSHEFATDANWSDNWPVAMADVNGDGRSDIVGFAPGGAVVSLSSGLGFAAQAVWTTGFRTGIDWSESWPRLIGDVNGDGMSDIVGVAPGGVVVSLSDGARFGAGGYWTHDFRAGYEWTAPWPILLGDVNGDGNADLIGLSAQGIVVALSDGIAFGPRYLWMHNGGPMSQWHDPWPVASTDIDGDGKDDLLAFMPEGASLAISTGEEFLPSRHYWIWGADDTLDWPGPLETESGDVNGDGRSDVIGFGPRHLVVSYGSSQ